MIRPPAGSRSGSASVPARWAAVSSAGPSSSASGLPPTAPTSASATRRRQPGAPGEVEGVGAAELVERQGRQLRPAVERLAAKRADDEHRDPDPLGPPGQERDRLAGGLVQPLHVVDGDHDRRQPGHHGGERVQDRAAVRRPRLVKRQRHPQRPALGWGELVHLVEHRFQQLAQAGEGEGDLALHPGGAQHPAGVRGGRRQQRALADPGTPGDDECPGAAHELPQPRQLDIPSDQLHRPEP